jgi:large conductance mechanosensitive channel
MSFAQEFKAFIMRGNVLDLAVGVVIGAAFGAVVSSFVNDIVMPPIGKVTGGLDFKDYFVTLNGREYPTLAAAKAAAAPVIAYGNFINTVLTFVIIAFCIFLLIKAVNRMHRPKAAEAPAASKQEVLLTEIRDLLASRQPNV